MTLAFALRGSDGLVLGADSRASSSEGSTDTSTKFMQINREIGIMTYGLAEVGYSAIERLVRELNKTHEFNTVKTQRIVHLTEISKLAAEIFQDVFAEWIKKTSEKLNQELYPEDPLYEVGFILGGYDANESNQFKILWWVSPDFKEEERGDIIAAQWHVSQYLSNLLYYPEMNVEQLKSLAVFLLTETELATPAVGGQFKIATVTLENGFQHLHDSEIQNINNENQPRHAKFLRILLENVRSNTYDA